MANIGLDGNDAPLTLSRTAETPQVGIPGSVPYLVYIGTLGRGYTWYGREPFNPDYALGLVDALSKKPPVDVWRERIRASFRGFTAAEFEDYRASVLGSLVELGVDVRRL